MTLIAAHLNAGVILVVTVCDRYIISLFPHLHTPPLLPVPNKPRGFCGRYAPCLLYFEFPNPGELKRREVELGCHRELTDLLLQVSTVASGTLSLSICFAQFVETAISEAHKVAWHWRGPHLLNIAVLAMADGLFGLYRSERADALKVSPLHPPPPALRPLPCS